MCVSVRLYKIVDNRYMSENCAFDCLITELQSFTELIYTSYVGLCAPAGG